MLCVWMREYTQQFSPLFFPSTLKIIIQLDGVRKTYGYNGIVGYWVENVSKQFK